MQGTAVLASQHNNVLPVVHVERITQVVNVITTRTCERPLFIKPFPELQAHDAVKVDVVKSIVNVSGESIPVTVEP